NRHALYEYYQGGDSQWGSCMFNHNRKEVCSFLISAAHYWLEEYHFDGLRIDAVSNLIYVNGSQDQGENKAGQEFIRNLNTIIRKLHPTAMLFAEDSSPWQGGVTKPVKEGGLGFDYKWNMGWMYDTLYFLGLPANQRLEQYHKMTFSMWYFYNERFLLSLSHDEVVNGAKTLLEKIPGEDPEKFAQLRTYYLYMYIHPGKKLNFMGNELGERVEWNEGRGLFWELLEEPAHKALYDYLCTLQKLYASKDAFFAHELDTNQFQWLYCKQETEPVYVMMRTGAKESYVAVLNFSDHVVEDFELVLDKKQTWKLVLDSGWKKYGGERLESKEELKTVERIKKSENPEDVQAGAGDEASRKQAADKAESAMQDEKTKKAVKQIKEHVLKISLPSYSGKLYQII
ncbi:MAG: alpha amylase C-terminal domain-containing protein, partial [Lachnospiraceae bacterium]|nr:alpha amylase C-terminal domain-containing protein [Lachnospiraceae bacterium]